MDINSLIPGMLVNVSVRNVLSDGLLVSFLTFFTGTIDPFHLDRALAKCKAGQKVKARVLYCDPIGKQLSLSLLPHLVGWGSPELPGRGEVFEKATGVFVRSWGSAGEGPGQFRLPWGMAVSGEGQLWVCDFENSRVQLFE